MTLQEIIKAVDDGKKVFWKSDDFPIIHTCFGIMIDSKSSYSFGCKLPVSFAHGTKDFEPETFYIKEES